MNAVTVRLEQDQLDYIVAQLLAGTQGGNGGPLTISEAAKRLGRSPDTIRRRIKAGLIATVPNDNSRVPQSEINRLLTP